MQPHAAAAATEPAIATLPGRFMLDLGTYAIGNGLGFEGLDFYVAGRGGALGATDGHVVAAAFVFWEPSTVVANWAKAGDVMPPLETARAFAEVGAQWGRDHLSETVDLQRLSVLVGRVIDRANPAAAPLFAAWREMPLPDDVAGRVLLQLNVLRELRGALHGLAVLAAGIAPDVAVRLATPSMVPIYGWPETGPADEPANGESIATRWAEADRTTNRLVGAALGVLAEPELDELVALATAAVDTASGEGT
jgi:hypothetical protein